MNHECFQIIFYLIFYLTRLIKGLLDRHFLIVLVYTPQFFYFDFFELRFDIGIPALPPWPFHLLLPGNLLARVCVQHGLRTPNEAFFHWNPELWAWADIGVFSAELSAPILVQGDPFPYFPLFNHYFYKKLGLFLYSHPKYLFGIGIWIWVAKN